MPAFRLSLIVCTYNRARFVRRLLVGLLAEVEEAGDVEIVVVDNNSSDDTQAVIARLAHDRPFIRCVFEAKQGLSYARNCGAAAAAGSHLLFLDDDALAPEGFVGTMRCVVAEHDPDFFGGPIYPIYADPPPREFPEHLETRKKAATSGFHPDLTLSGGNFGVRKATLERLGGFDPRYGMTGGKSGLLEERLLIDAYRESTPPAAQRLYYAVEGYVFHHTPRERMEFSFQRKRIALGECQMTRHALARGVRNAGAFRRAALHLHLESLITLIRTLISPRTNAAARFSARMEAARTFAVVRASIVHGLTAAWRRAPAQGQGPLRLLWLETQGGPVNAEERDKAVKALARLPVQVDRTPFDPSHPNPQLQAQLPASLKAYDAVLFEGAIPPRTALLARAHCPHLQLLLLNEAGTAAPGADIVISPDTAWSEIVADCRLWMRRAAKPEVQAASVRAPTKTSAV